jgi:hypothetical protein
MSSAKDVEKPAQQHKKDDGPTVNGVEKSNQHKKVDGLAELLAKLVIGSDTTKAGQLAFLDGQAIRPFDGVFYVVWIDKKKEAAHKQREARIDRFLELAATLEKSAANEKSFMGVTALEEVANELWTIVITHNFTEGLRNRCASDPKAKAYALGFEEWKIKNIQFYRAIATAANNMFE